MGKKVVIRGSADAQVEDIFSSLDGCLVTRQDLVARPRPAKVRMPWKLGVKFRGGNAFARACWDLSCLLGYVWLMRRQGRPQALPFQHHS